MNYLFDSDVVIDFFNNEPSTIQLIEKIGERSSYFAISALTVTELLSGWKDEKAGKYLPILYDIFAVENVTKLIAQQAGKWRFEYKSRGIQLQVVDTTIAATAYLGDFVLVTNNIKDYPMSEVKIYHK